MQSTNTINFEKKFHLQPNNVIWSLRLIYILFMIIPALMTRLVFPNIGPLTPEQVDKMFFAGLVADLIFYAPTFFIWLYLVEKFKKSCHKVAQIEPFNEKAFKEILQQKKTLYISYIPLNVISVVLVSITGVYYLIYVLNEPNITLRYAFNFVLTILAFVLIFILFALLIIDYLTTSFILLVINPEKIAYSQLTSVKSVSLRIRSYFISLISTLSLMILIIGGLSDKISIEEMGAIFLFLIIYLLLNITLFSQSLNPVISLQNELKKILSGKLITGERVFITSFDETGTLAQLYNLFLSKFFETLEQLQQESEKLRKIIHEYQETFNEVMGQVAEINSALGTYTHATQEISNNTQTNVEFLNELVQLIEDWGNSIINLTEKFKDIALQIKILALNAAIEASREGGQSKGGFTVIAQNVQEFSENLQQINKEIVKLTTQLKEKILQEAQNVQAALEENAALVEENASQVEEITATLEEITAMIEQLREQTSEISEVSENLTTVVEQYLAAAK